MPDADTLFIILLILTTAGCGFMAGLVVFVDVVHYPAFHFIDKNRGKEFHSFHSRYTGLVVGGPMLLEAVTGALMPFIAMAAGSSALLQLGAWLTFALLVAIWAETGLRVIPKHRNIGINGLHNPAHVVSLVRANRLRTIMWCIRYFILLLMIIFLLFVPLVSNGLKA